MIRLNGVRHSTITLDTIKQAIDTMEDLASQRIDFSMRVTQKVEEKSFPLLPTLKTEHPLPPLPKINKSRNNGIVVTG
jgi:hypothetical protein|tara:strand:- start:284 stop:517 length:234 start_codon:yes stop_codon:yes gene_type:complete